MLTAALWLACSAPPPDPPPVRVEGDVHPGLEAAMQRLQPTVVEPVPGVHVAIGYALANVVMIRGEGAVAIVDTTEGREPATEVLAAFREITSDPVELLVLTHNHADHVFGGQVFAEGREIPVWAHATLERRVDEVVSVVRDAIHVRSARMFGTALPPEARAGNGIGTQLRFRAEDIALLRPTHTFDERASVEVGGVRLELLHAPGETDDQIAVWLPDSRVLLPADNVYEAFPNLYTIRGTPYRDVRRWVETLDRLRDLEAEALVPSHTRPVVGREAVSDVLTAYRDAIQFVHDQTVRGINAGRTPDELAATIQLPPHLAAHPWLQEHYGRVPWSVRAVYAGTLGWFDGDAATLEPLPPDELARRWADAVGGGEPIGTLTREALDAGELAWAAELASTWHRAAPDDPVAREALAQALDGLALGHVNANAIHWYRTRAAELRGQLALTSPPAGAAPLDLVDGLPLHAFMRGLSTRLRAEAAIDADLLVLFEFTDVGRTYVVHVRRGVAEVRERPPPTGRAPDLHITATERAWKRVAAGKIGAGEALAAGELWVSGGPLALASFLSWFERS